MEGCRNLAIFGVRVRFGVGVGVQQILVHCRHDAMPMHCLVETTFRRGRCTMVLVVETRISSYDRW